MSEAQKKIANLSKARHNILKVNHDDPKVDKMAKKIWSDVKKHQDDLPIEFILETVTGLGAAPSLIYDDNGYWTVGGDGSQNMISPKEHKKETVFQASWIVGPRRWKRSIRQAIRDYLEER